MGNVCNQLQNYELASLAIRERFLQLKREKPQSLAASLNFSWSNWMFGREPLVRSAKRLASAGIEYVELHGNHYGVDLGYRPDEVNAILADCGISVAGICGMFSPENNLSSDSPRIRQAAVDYIRRELDFAAETDAGYMLVVPGAVGQPDPVDDYEFARSADTVRLVADRFVECGVAAAIEPIRSAEVSIVHSIADASAFIEAVDHPGVQHINADVYHMQSEESHIGEALASSGSRLLNVHLADSNRMALGQGSMDLDTIIMALYLVGFNCEGHYVTPEPLGPGGNPYPAMHGDPDPGMLDEMVSQSVRYFRERERLVRNL